MNRHLSRIIVMQSLYEWDFRGKEEPEVIAERNIEAMGEEVDRDFIFGAINGVKKHHQAIDQKITEAAPEWPLEQIATIDKAILRLSLYELLFSNEVPPKVAINEAVELAKAYGSENSSKFVNGVLGTIYRATDKFKQEEKKDKEQKNGKTE